MQQFFLWRATCLFLALFFMTFGHVKAASMLRYVFGSQPVSSEIQKVSDVADKMTNFDTALFKMNWLAKQLGYSSFNWFNTTWVDEEVVQGKPKNALLWQLIHEKYHVIAGHDWRRVIGAGAVVMPLIRGIFICAKHYARGKDFPIIPYVIPFELPETLLALFLFLWHEEYCELIANTYADQMMREGIIASERDMQE